MFPVGKEEKKVNMTILEKDAVVQYVVKYIASFHFYSLSFFNAFLLADSVVIEIKILVASVGNMPE